MIPEGIFQVDALHRDVQSLADRPIRAANMPVDRRQYIGRDSLKSPWTSFSGTTKYSPKATRCDFVYY